MKKELQGLYDLCISNGIAESDLKPYFATIESNLKTKRYGLVWEEQLEDIAADLKNKFPILVEIKDLSINADPNGLTNCLIEGDNYESLTFLKNSGVKVDCIYIDPPYNTGNQDFVYNDKYIDSEDTWRHSSWLSFMNKRLKLAKELLTEDGVIFISIDDNEQAQLKLLCDSVFGEKNYLNTVIWHYGKMSNESRRFANNHEYVLIYGCSEKSYIKPIMKKEDTEYKERWKNYVRDNRIYFGDVKNKNDKMINARIRIDCERLNIKELPDSHILYDFDVEYKVDSDVIYVPIIKGNSVEKVSDFGLGQKPISLLFRLLSAYPKKDAIVLDFFAGSGSTGHAVLELNKEDGGTRKFILCTNNEVSYQKELEYLKKLGKVSGVSKKELTDSYKEYQSKDEYEFFKDSEDYASLGICRSVTYERLNRVINGYTTSKGKEVVGISSNLKYYKVKNIDTIVNQMEIEDVLIENIVPFVQFKHNVWSQETVAEDLIELTNDSESVFIYSNTLYLCDGFYEFINSSVKPTTLYIYAGLFEFLDEERLVNVNILSITNEFYKN